MTRLDQLTADIGSSFGDRWISSEAKRAQFMAAEGHHAPLMPDLVVQPASVEDVQRLVIAAAKAGVPIVPLGVGTSPVMYQITT